MDDGTSHQRKSKPNKPSAQRQGGASNKLANSAMADAFARLKQD